MKDEFDDVTPDMFERGSDKKVSKPTGTTYVQDKTNGEKAAKSTVKAPARAVSGGGSAGTLPNDKSGLDRPRLYKKGGTVSSASKRADGCVTKGRTKGRFV